MNHCPHCGRKAEITGTWLGKQGPELIGFLCRACARDWSTEITAETPRWMLTAAGIANLRRAEMGARFVA